MHIFLQKLKPLFCVVLLLTIAACGAMGLSKKVSYPSDVSSQMETAFNDAERAYNRHEYDKAMGQYQSYLDTFPYNKLADESVYKMGKIYFIRKKWGGVLDEMDRLRAKTPDPMYRAKGGLLAAFASFQNADFQNALRWLDDTHPDDLPDKLQLRYYSLYIHAGQQLSVRRERLDYAYLRLNDVYESGASASMGEITAEGIVSQSETIQKIDSWIVSPMTPSTIPSWFSSYPQSASRGFVEYKWGKVYFEAQMTDKAKKKLSQFVSSYPKNRYADSGRTLLQSLGQDMSNLADNRETLKVGVLLPFSGTKGSYGEATLRGIRCAAGQLEGCGDNIVGKYAKSLPVELIIKDSSNSPDVMASQMAELNALNVSAIIGPMSASLSEAAGKQAQALRMPVFPITQKTDLMRESDYVFQMGFEAMSQMTLLVKEARNRGQKLFAVFYPANAYGQEMSDAFVRAVEASGGKVVVKTSYNPEAPDLNDFARQLKTNVSRFELGTNNLGFHSVFVPDSFASIPRIISAFEINSITDIPLLGTTAWNDPRLPVDLLTKYPGSFYVDLFNPARESGIIPAFAGAMRALSGRNPTSIEALGFDALWSIRNAALQKGSTDKMRIREALSQMTGLDGVTGITGFKSREGLIINPFILTSATE